MSDDGFLLIDQGRSDQGKSDQRCVVWQLIHRVICRLPTITTK